MNKKIRRVALKDLTIQWTLLWRLHMNSWEDTKLMMKERDQVCNIRSNIFTKNEGEKMEDRWMFPGQNNNKWENCFVTFDRWIKGVMWWQAWSWWNSIEWIYNCRTLVHFLSSVIYGLTAKTQWVSSGDNRCLGNKKHLWRLKRACSDLQLGYTHK